MAGKILLKTIVFLFAQKQRPTEVRFGALQKTIVDKDLEKQQEIASTKKDSLFL